MGAEAAVQLRPRQAGLLLEPHEPLWEVVASLVWLTLANDVHILSYTMMDSIAYAGIKDGG